MNKKISRALICMLALTACLPASAQSTNQMNTTTLSQEEIKSLSNEEFDEFMVTYMRENYESEKDFDSCQEELSELGVLLSEAPEITTKYYTDNTDAKYIAPSSVDLTSYSAKRGGESFYRLYGEVVHNDTEGSTASLDLLSVEWDSAKASYYSTNALGTATYMDGSQRNNGICLFNVEDEWMYAGDYATAVVYVTPKSSATSIDYGSKYVHTYGTTDTNWSVGGSIGYESGGPTGGFTYQINGANSTEAWQLYSDNTLYLK